MEQCVEEYEWGLHTILDSPLYTPFPIEDPPQPSFIHLRRRLDCL